MALNLQLDGPEYIARTQQDFVLPDLDVNLLRAAVPKEAFEKSTFKALRAIIHIPVLSVLLVILIHRFDHKFGHNAFDTSSTIIAWSGWVLYWIAQSILWAGVWTIGHEATHNNLSDLVWVNSAIGMVCNSFIFVPYFSWRITHLRHHRATGSMESEEVYVPYVRSDFNLPPPHKATKEELAEAFEESPIYCFLRLLVMQFLGYHTYFTFNTMGSKRYPPGSNHWNPFSGLFSKDQHAQVIASDIGIFTMASLLGLWAYRSGFAEVAKIYLIPFAITNHWVVAMTFLQHSCSTIPHYRGDAWTRARGALATVDRPFLGPVDKLVLMGVNTYHTTHHLFSSIPFYNLPQAHEAVRPLLGDMYNYDSSWILWALWRTFNECVFVEDEGEVVFYKDKHGIPRRKVKSS
ncbi:hypothetical protein QCA50_011907 [Cerrena zonata]|uniref:Fatty acid desaturase domain-containing protein n=1 Tax=Cerrena zonata TaxID=2478898 RepID=A0AAW0G1S4_9APHY